VPEGWCARDGNAERTVRAGRDLRERYDVPEELPPELLRLVSKLDDSDWLLPNVSWQNDVDLLFG
jgi:hypothetical protein